MPVFQFEAWSGGANNKGQTVKDEIEALNTDDAIQKLRDDISRQEGEVESRKVDLHQRIADIRQHRQTLEKERREIAGEIESQYLAMYERVHKGHPDGVAIVAANNYVCTGCNMTLPPNIVNHLMGNEKLIVCPSCQRILYLDPS